MTESDLLPENGRAGFWQRFPWWLAAALILIGSIFYFIVTDPDYNDAFQEIVAAIFLYLLLTIPLRFLAGVYEERVVNQV